MSKNNLAEQLAASVVNLYGEAVTIPTPKPATGGRSVRSFTPERFERGMSEMLEANRDLFV